MRTHCLNDGVDGDPLLTVRGITRRFADRTVLAGIDLDVAAGEAVGVVGPNGSGKSTLLRCIVGADTADERHRHAGRAPARRA